MNLKSFFLSFFLKYRVPPPWCPGKGQGNEMYDYCCVCFCVLCFRFHFFSFPIHFSAIGWNGKIVFICMYIYKVYKFRAVRKNDFNSAAKHGLSSVYNV